MKTKELDNFRDSRGIKIITTLEFKPEKVDPIILFQFHSSVLNKQELSELINWLISKMDESYD